LGLITVLPANYVILGRLNLMPFKEVTPSMLIPSGVKMRSEFAAVELNRLIEFVNALKHEVILYV